MYVPQGLFDADRIARPTDADVVRYAGVDRREFLKYLGAAGAGLLAARCGGSPSQPTDDCRTTGCPANQACVQESGAYNCKPTAKVTVTGNIRGTYSNAPLAAKVSYGANSQQSSDDNYSILVPVGTYDVTVDGGRIQRVRKAVAVADNMNLDLDALDQNVNVTDYREMCLGIGSPTGALFNLSGKGSRFPVGVMPKVIVVRSSLVTAAYYSAVDQARSVFGEITGGILNNGTIEFVDSASNVPEGGIVVKFSPGFSAGLLSKSGDYILTSSVHASTGIMTNGNPAGYISAMKHEFVHAIGFDHTNDQTSLMNNLGLTPYPSNSGIPSRDDIMCGCLKYKRLGGHQLDETKDSD